MLSNIALIRKQTFANNQPLPSDQPFGWVGTDRRTDSGSTPLHRNNYSNSHFKTGQKPLLISTDSPLPPLGEIVWPPPLSLLSACLSREEKGNLACSLLLFRDG